MVFQMSLGGRPMGAASQFTDKMTLLKRFSVSKLQLNVTFEYKVYSPNQSPAV
jgi:hypothetical protein